ncbi:MAG: DUF481 domain-containing protein [Myxococcales bacterium]|nr:DUF481 domain-containing protein [Myxococcales bacterium]
MKLRIALLSLGLSLLQAGFALVAMADDPEAAKQFDETVVEESTLGDETLWNASAGGVWSAGNTKQLTMNAGSEARYVRGHHGASGKLGIVYGAADTGSGFEKNAFNINTRIRYDYYVTHDDAVFAAFVYRHDRFAGLDHRVEGQVGYQRHFFRFENHRFWGELGYDITVDRWVLDSPVFDALGTQTGTIRAFDWVDPVHAGRAYLGYENRLNENVSFLSGVEVLMNLELPEDTRVNWDTSLSSTLVDSLSLQVGFLLQFDNVPVPGKQKLDTQTRLNLVYEFI